MAFEIYRGHTSVTAVNQLPEIALPARMMQMTSNIDAWPFAHWRIAHSGAKNLVSSGRCVCI